MRKVEILHDNWLFRKGDFPEEELFSPSFMEEKYFEKISCPHDWAVKGPFDPWYEPLIAPGEGGKLTFSPGNSTGCLPYMGCGIYLKKFTLPEEENKVYKLEFDGVMSHSTIYLNGKKAHGCVFGYTSFSVDITEFVLPGGEENILIVKVENPPYLTRWYPGAGIYREVRLLTLEKKHFPYEGIFLQTKELDVEKKTALLEVTVEGFSPEEFTIHILEGEKKTAEGKSPLSLSQLKLWSPEEPFLYKVILQSEKDFLSFSYGFRKIEIHSDKGLSLNGKPYRIKGLCMHHDLGVLGAAFHKEVMRNRLKKIKKINCNALRMAHNPPDPKLLDLCDEMGFLVLDEAFDVWEESKTSYDYSREFAENFEKDLVSLIRRDRNHPCVFMWSIGNEIREEILPKGVETARKLVAICHREDSGRMVTCAINHQSGEDHEVLHKFVETLDVAGFNYQPSLYPLLHKRFPGKPILGTETAAVNTSRGEYYFPIVEGEVKHPLYSSGYALEYASWSSSSESMFKALYENPFVLGEFAWCTFDYLGEPFPYQYPARSSAWGLFDLAGLPKDRAFFYQAQWHEKGREEVLHILPHWEWQEGETIPIHIFTSCSSVELFLNGRSLGRRKKELISRLVWEEIPFEKGGLTAIGYNEEGKEIQRTSRITPGKFVSIGCRLETEKKEGGRGFYAFMELFAKDEKGNPINDSSEELSFTLQNGKLLGVDNGDSASLLPFLRDYVKLYHGRAVVTAFMEGRGDLTVSSGNIREKFIINSGEEDGK